MQSGFIIAGIFAIVFSIGFFYDDGAPSHRLGAVFGLLGSGALCVSGIFPAPASVIHLVARYILFLLVPIGMLLIGGTFIDASHKGFGSLSIILGIIALAGTSVVSYARGIAEIPVTFAVFIWIVIYSVRMLWHALHQMSN